ncbi:2-oxo acid dehydrogenase subunit E2 [Actinomadura sp. KC345]|uniref:dihydrolipoamide acetyltransferase family protein n=1 Tax=Actinomadura sp. KC345 TaxID=2530371 RepID=UPI00104ACB9E|nr:dihydrolipoamide acetyltransferase family protein [Actinomadura sp. KC345]TDC46882.1 2-oxo acid dehydrogenase subunit E2 [Actinomadura sp. KC345]
MSATQVFHLPDVGEGLTEAEIVGWRVDVGDRVRVNDVVVEIESAKSLVELPVPFAGVVAELHAGVGETVPVGAPLIGVSREGSAPEPASTASRPDRAEAGAEAGREEPDRREEPQMLVGGGPWRQGSRRIRIGARRQEWDARRPARSAREPEAPAPAAPVRETRSPVTGVRKATAAAVTRSAFTAPHVTEWVTVDVTATMELTRRLRSDRAWSDVRMTPLVLVARAVLLAVRGFPGVNASWDEDRREIVVKHYVDLGIAAATSRGLLVPAIRDAHELGLRELAGAIAELVGEARTGTTPPDRLTGGTITITNIGAFGVDGGTPILNPGEAAILAMGAIKKRPWAAGDALVVREVATLALSFDHRLVDGELGSRFLTRVASFLEDPGTALLHA